MILICIIEMSKVIMTRQSSQDLHFSPHNYTDYKKIQQISSSLVQNQKTLNQKALTFGFGITFTATCSPLLSPFLNLTVGVCVQNGHDQIHHQSSYPKLLRLLPLCYIQGSSQSSASQSHAVSREQIWCVYRRRRSKHLLQNLFGLEFPFVARVFLEKGLSTGPRLTFL